jgi:DNA polymerase-3 subunit epsilon
MQRFAAIDFETADYGPDSACALAVVQGEGRRIVGTSSYLIRPPRREFAFTWLHGISWRDVADQPTFAELWPRLQRELAGVDVLVAHNAAFDRGVLHACCQRAKVEPPPHDFHCTVKIARHVWGLRPANLPAVCRHLGIPLDHHRAESDATACARIFIAALRTGDPLPPVLGPRRGARTRTLRRRG